MGLFKDRLLPAFADWIGKRVEPDLAPHRRSTLEQARGRVLEIGAGTGFNAAHYPDSVEELVITEPWEGALRRAERRAGEAGRPADFVATGAERLPFEDESFDTVVSTLVLCTVPEPDRALAEIRRVLRPGGQFLFMEHVRSDDERLSRWQDRLERPWRVVAMGCHPNRSTLERIEAAGFEVEELRRGELPKVPPIARPMITGRAVAAKS